MSRKSIMLRLVCLAIAGISCDQPENRSRDSAVSGNSGIERGILPDSVTAVTAAMRLLREVTQHDSFTVAELRRHGDKYIVTLFEYPLRTGGGGIVEVGADTSTTIVSLFQ